MNRYLILAAALCLAVGLAPPAQGRVVIGLTIEMEPPETGPAAGQPYEGRLWIHVPRDMDLKHFAIEGTGWTDLTWTPRGLTALRADQPLAVEFSGVPPSAATSLRIIAMADGKTVRRDFTMGGAEFERDRAVRPLQPTDLPLPAVRGSAAASPRPAGPAVRIDDALAPEKDRLSYDIRVHGRLAYRRDSAMTLGADGLTVQICDKDLLIDDVLGTTVTGTDGTFDLTVHWDSQIGETYPDLYVVFRAENTEVTVKRWYMIDPYLIAIGPWENYQGLELNVGNVLPVEEDAQAIPHLVSNYTRFWRYMNTRGHDTSFLKVHWPEPEEDGAYYTSATETIHLARSDQWESGTQSHEFGHHVHHGLASMPDIDYCNGVCDRDEPSDCGHCDWCEEDEDIAWVEGWAQYISHVITPTFDALYGTPAINTREYENLHRCVEDTLWDEALVTEGFTAAVLVDIDDTHVDDDPHTAGFGDRMALGGQAVLDLLDDYGAMGTVEFLRDALAAYPEQKENLWWTAMNNGFDLDEAPPDLVTPIVCGTHLPGVPSANPNATFHWQRPDDDASGVQGYAVAMREGAPINPIGFGWVDDVTTVTFSDLAPGTYYFCIRPADWSEKWCDDYSSSGPYIITEPEPRNLVFELQTGWDFYVLPRGTADTEPQDCTLPPTLDGTAPTYWNLFARNDGDLSTGADMIAGVEVDGVELDRVSGGDVGGGLTFLAMNQGPVTVRGGLHTFAGCLDPDGLIEETSESDNRIGLQLTWRPPTVTPQSVYYNALPVPDPTGGWGSVSAPFKIYNCFGLNFNSSGRWNAFVMWSDNPTADYDLRLHQAVESSQGGFAVTTASSGQPAGWADAVLVNRHQAGTVSWDAGIINPALDSAALKYQHATSAAVAFGDSVTEVMGLNEYIFLREFEVEFIENKDISLDLWTDPPQADVLFAWRDSDFVTGSILEADGVALTGPDGRAHLDVEAQAEGFTCLMICRQPKDGDADLQVTYRIRPTLPDLEPVHLAGWHAPVVPRAQANAAADLVALPTTLPGGYEQTWYNFGVVERGVPSLPGIPQTPPRAQPVHGAHDGQALVQRHDRRLQLAAADHPHEGLGLVGVAAAPARQVDDLVAAGPGLQHEPRGPPPRAAQGDAALGAQDARLPRRVHPQRTGQDRQLPAGVAQQDGGLLVHARGAQGGHGLHLHRLAADEVGQVQGIDPQVQQRAAAQCGREQPAPRIERRVEPEIGHHRAHLADGPVPRQLAGADHRRQEPGPHGLHQHHAGGAGRGDHAFDLRRVQGQGLLAQHVLALGQAEQGVLAVEGVGGADVDGIDGRVGGQFGVAAVGVGSAEFGRERSGPPVVARADGRQFGPGGLAQALGEGARDPARPQDAPADGLHGRLPVRVRR